MNFSKEAIASTMASLNWATADEDYTPGTNLLRNPNPKRALTLAEVLPSTEPPSGSYKSDAQRSRLNKRKATSNALMQTREELFAGEFDG